MASPNAPKSSEHSTARYITYSRTRYLDDYAEPSMTSRTAVDQQARKYR